MLESGGWQMNDSRLHLQSVRLPTWADMFVRCGVEEKPSKTLWSWKHQTDAHKPNPFGIGQWSVGWSGLKCSMSRLHTCVASHATIESIIKGDVGASLFH